MLIPMAQLTHKYLRRAVALAALAVLSLAAACADKAAKTATADSSLTRDLALAGQQASVPSFQDTAVAPAPKPAVIAPKEPPAPVRTPRAARPKNPPPKPVEQAPVQAPAPVAQQPAMAPVPAPSAAPIVSEIGAGSGGTLTSGSKVCSSTNLPGDKLVATLASDVTGTNGAVIPAGSTVVLEVASVTPGQSAETAQLGLHVRSVIVNDKTYNVDATVTPTTPLEKSKIPDADPNADKKKVIGGAIAGAILGQMIGHNTKGTIIGAAAGAATGAAVAKSGGEKWQACLPSGASLRLTLNAPLVISS